jgi:hypothetical protein
MSLLSCRRAELTSVQRFALHAFQQDTIERLGIERAAIYRRCKFEDIQVPLVSGSLDDVPMEALDEVRALLLSHGL